MNVLDENQALSLAFIDAANKGGCKPRREQLEEWLRQPGTRTEIMAFDVLAQFASRLSANLGAVSETMTDSLIRLSWVEIDSHEQLTLTRLGGALLRSSNTIEDDSSTVTPVLLGANDELAYPRLIHRLAQAVNGALVDPYLRVDQLFSVVAHTPVTKFLVSEALPAEDRASIAVFVESHRKSTVEVRVAKKHVLHDRLIVCEEFVDTIGTSLNTVGSKHSTVLTPMPATIADFARQQFDKWWDDAEVLAFSRREIPADGDED